MLQPLTYRSFLLRLWRSDESAGALWGGELEEIQSGQITPVSSLDEVFRLIRRHTVELDELHRPEESESPQ